MSDYRNPLATILAETYQTVDNMAPALLAMVFIFVLVVYAIGLMTLPERRWRLNKREFIVAATVAVLLLGLFAFLLERTS
jgi:hypothetical protein